MLAARLTARANGAIWTGMQDAVTKAGDIANVSGNMERHAASKELLGETRKSMPVSGSSD